MGIIEQLYLATDTIHGVYHKTHKVVNTINGNSKVILSVSKFSAPNIAFLAF